MSSSLQKFHFPVEVFPSLTSALAQTSKNVADTTFKAMNSNLLNVFHFYKKFWVFFLNSDIIPKLHILKLKVLLSTMVTIVAIMCIVRKGQRNVWWPKDVGNHHH